MIMECFKIRVLRYENGDDIFNINKGNPLLDLNAGNCYLTPNPTIIEADPFLFVKGDRLFLFYESKRLKDPGVLKMTSTQDFKKWTKPVVVLKESFHLSFPYVFEDNGDIYMIPETGAVNSIRLYKATSPELNKFELFKTLIEAPMDAKIAMGYGDNCVIRHNDKYYLFTQLQYEDKINTLELFVSDSLTGKFSMHCKSPIQHSQKFGRNAGAILEHNRKMYRFSQDCTRRYGDNVHISEITKISTTDYDEHVVYENIIPVNNRFYKEGGHQYNAVEFNGQFIVATDAKEYHNLMLQRIFNKIERMLFLRS